jgi:K(+)-stimulated pyrophosphate-energized sodium pump
LTTLSDIADTFSIAVVSAMMLGTFFLNSDDYAAVFKEGIVLLPAVLGGAGLLITALAGFFVRTRENSQVRKAINAGELVVFVSSVAASYFIIDFLLPKQWIIVSETTTSTIQTTYTSIGVFWAVLTGIVAGAFVSILSDLSSGIGSKSVSKITSNSVNGAASNVLSGLEAGLRSSILPIMGAAFALFFSYRVAGFYGIAMASVGFLFTAAYRIAVDAFGAIAENAGDIARSTGQDHETTEHIERLEYAGNNSFAIVKTFASYSGWLTSIAVIVIMSQIAKLETIDILNPLNLAVLVFGAVVPVIISSGIMDAVIRTSAQIIAAVKGQYNSIPELKAATDVARKYNGDVTLATEDETLIIKAAEEKVDYSACTQTATEFSMKETVYPILVAVVFPIAVGVIGGTEILSIFLCGALVSGIILSTPHILSGFQWSNVKKVIRTGVSINDSIYGKNSELYKNASVGDSLGDPLKDVVAPSISSTIKIMAVISLILTMVLTA